MKETFYFSHDYHARSDAKVTKLIKEMGYEGYGLFWGLVEMLYEADGFLEEDYDNIAYALRTDSERIAKLVKDYNLFSVASKKIHSNSVLARLRARKGKSEKARQSAVLRWNKQKKEDANAMRTQCEGNAIKESKVKESKVKEISIAEASSAEVIPNLLNDKQRHIQIIGLYAEAKKIFFENVEQQRAFIRRNLRASQDLKGYDFEKIVEVMKYLSQNADFKWTLESVGKFITEDLNNLNARKSRLAIIN